MRKQRIVTGKGIALSICTGHTTQNAGKHQNAEVCDFQAWAPYFVPPRFERDRGVLAWIKPNRNLFIPALNTNQKHRSSLEGAEMQSELLAPFLSLGGI